MHKRINSTAWVALSCILIAVIVGGWVTVFGQETASAGKDAVC